MATHWRAWLTYPHHIWRHTHVRMYQVLAEVLDIDDSADLQRIRIETVLNTITSRVTRLVRRQEADDQMCVASRGGDRGC